MESIDRKSLPDVLDISPELSVRTPVWPGDQPLCVRFSQRIADGDATNLSAITLTAHLGAHVDAPLHLLDDGADVGSLALASFIGPATLVDLTGTKAVTARELAAIDLVTTERLLVKTGGTRRSSDAGVDAVDFAHFTLDAAEMVARAGLLLLGIDTPSVDAADADDLPVHRTLARAGVAILEGLELGAVAPGRYELIAMPLSFRGVEASPVRAVLRPLA
jgi:arylformamidase